MGNHFSNFSLIFLWPYYPLPSTPISKIKGQVDKSLAIAKLLLDHGVPLEANVVLSYFLDRAKFLQFFVDRGVDLSQVRDQNDMYAYTPFCFLNSYFFF